MAGWHVYKTKEREKQQRPNQWAKASYSSFREKNIVGIEDKSDISEDYKKDDRIPPFTVNKDPSIQLNDEDTPWLQRDHNQGIYVKKKFTTVPAWYI